MAAWVLALAGPFSAVAPRMTAGLHLLAVLQVPQVQIFARV